MAASDRKAQLVVMAVTVSTDWTAASDRKALQDLQEATVGTASTDWTAAKGRKAPSGRPEAKARRGRSGLPALQEVTAGTESTE
jgi:hypothetical protein